MGLTGPGHVLKRNKRRSLVAGQHPRTVPQGGLFPGAFVSTAGAMPGILISRGGVTGPALLREASECHCGVTGARGPERVYSNTPRSAGKQASEEVSNRLSHASKQENQRESGGEPSQGCTLACLCCACGGGCRSQMLMRKDGPDGGARLRGGCAGSANKMCQPLGGDWRCLAILTGELAL